MDVNLFSGKLGITPENLYTLVRSFAVSFFHEEENGRTRRGYYRAEAVPNSTSIHINDIHGEWAGDVIVIPLTPFRSHVVITFNDWENNPAEHTWALSSELTPNPEKRRLFLELGHYILHI